MTTAIIDGIPQGFKLMRKILYVAFAAHCLAFVVAASGQEREKKVRSDRQTVEEQGYWIYNDLPKGFDEAKKTGKPLLVAIRCIPCEACAQLDAQVVSRDPAVRKLLDEFVCVTSSVSKPACFPHTRSTSISV